MVGKKKKMTNIKYIYICLLKNYLKYEVSINTSIHLGMRIHFFHDLHFITVKLIKMTFSSQLLHLRCDGFVLNNQSHA